MYLLKHASVSLFAFVLVIWATGCTRDRYHRAADRDTRQILDEKTVKRPWDLPQNYSINADPRSRLFDDSDPDDPELPDPGPHLYSYEVPQMGPRPDPSGSATDDDLVPDFATAVADGWTSRSDSIVPAVSAIGQGWVSRSTRQVIYRGGQKGPQKDVPAAKPYADVEVGLTIQPIPREYWDAIPPVCLSRMFD